MYFGASIASTDKSPMMPWKDEDQSHDYRRGGSAIFLSDGSDEGSSSSKEYTSAPFVPGSASNPLDTLALVSGAQRRTITKSLNPSQHSVHIEATTTVITPTKRGTVPSSPLPIHQVTTITNMSHVSKINSLRASMDKAIVAIDELLGTKPNKTPTITNHEPPQNPPISPLEPTVEKDANPEIKASTSAQPFVIPSISLDILDSNTRNLETPHLVDEPLSHEDHVVTTP
ncbi:hypothetical protein L6452_01550 [Arctium lappa]|uniref:Uncharacterized protein n=1 Tax=Arctium lappa TaxID=4217 RepID=A0ACB9FI03_ARCLA|nr:hypothetical protein L6452_01550 [Arctium lappa]